MQINSTYNVNKVASTLTKYLAVTVSGMLQPQVPNFTLAVTKIQICQDFNSLEYVI